MGIEIPSGFLSEWCETLSRDGEMPAISYLPTGLVLIAAIVGVKIKIRWTPVREERCNLWALNVGRSAMAKKTTGMSALRWGYKVAAERLEDQIRYHSVQRLSDAGLADLLDVVGKDTDREQKAENAAAKAEKREPKEIEPVVRGEPVSQIIALNEVAPLWGESRAEYKQGARQLLLDVYDGRLSSMTKTTQVADQEIFACALGNIPVAELAERTTESVLRSGFAGRWVIFEAPNPIRLISFPEVNGRDPLLQLAEKIRHLTHLNRYSEDVDDNRKLWSREALEARQEWYERRARTFSIETGADGDIWNRLQATGIKLATISAVSRMGASICHLGELGVCLGDAEWAETVVEASLATLMESVEAGGGVSDTPLGKVEQRVLAALKRYGATSETAAASVRRLTENTKGSFSRRDVLDALSSLHTAGFVEVAASKDGKPQVAWLTDSANVEAA